MMEGARHSGKWNRNAHFGAILILLFMSISTSTSLEPSGEQKCPHGDYSNNGVCCNKCSPGFKLLEMCQSEGQRSNCTQCPVGQYTEELNYSKNCFRCRQCKSKKHEFMVSKCELHRNTICRCEKGYYKKVIDSETYECLKCKQCKPDENLKQPCTPESNTECVCKEKYYRDNSGKCVPCKNCTTGCEQYCSKDPEMTTKDKSKDGFLINIITGAAAVSLLLLVLVILITYLATKWLTKKKMQRSSQQTVTQDSLEVLVKPSSKCVNAVPQSSVNEQEMLNLPDCVPLEIKISDLIYMVLDLVPVPQVKQLVRSLGVTDAEIERVEIDHRSCKEAHYQMLRVWAEQGSPTGRGGMLHRPLLLECLDKLRMMHMEKAAEELERKYGIQ